MSAKTRRLILTRATARQFTDVALSAASKDDFTPVICGALITVAGGKVRILCTDRYRAHTAELTLEQKSTEHEFIIPRAALMWLHKNVAHFGRWMIEEQRIVIETREIEEKKTALSIKVLNGEASESLVWNGYTTFGKFPPLLSLIEKARDAEAVDGTPLVTLEWLAKARNLGARETPARIKFTAGDNPNKPGPVYLSWTMGGDIYAEAIIQPHLDLR